MSPSSLGMTMSIVPMGISIPLSRLSFAFVRLTRFKLIKYSAPFFCSNPSSHIMFRLYLILDSCRLRSSLSFGLKSSCARVVVEACLSLSKAKTMSVLKSFSFKVYFPSKISRNSDSLHGLAILPFLVFSIIAQLGT